VLIKIKRGPALAISPTILSKTVTMTTLVVVIPVVRVFHGCVIRLRTENPGETAV
jgi:hypothetical protein